MYSGFRCVYRRDAAWPRSRRRCDDTVCEYCEGDK